VGGTRPSGTSLIVEDVCFPPERLADGAVDLQKLFVRHGYDGAVIGHASAGNLHFLITPSLNSESEIARFDGFLQDVARVTPIYSTCCAFAGDRGMLHPELTNSATSEQAEEIKGRLILTHESHAAAIAPG
jgi:FAD/FMN-containing dehydrogenase